MGFPCDVLSLPLHTLGCLAAQRHVRAHRREQGQPPDRTARQLRHRPRGIGNGVSLLRYVPWLGTARITYWGDLDVEGLAILSALRMMFPQAQSVFMDEAAVRMAAPCRRRNRARLPFLPILRKAREVRFCFAQT